MKRPWTGVATTHLADAPLLALHNPRLAGHQEENSARNTEDNKCNERVTHIPRNDAENCPHQDGERDEHYGKQPSPALPVSQLSAMILIGTIVSGSSGPKVRLWGGRHSSPSGFWVELRRMVLPLDVGPQPFL
jgi:hypothetical protein